MKSKLKGAIVVRLTLAEAIAIERATRSICVGNAANYDDQSTVRALADALAETLKGRP